MTDKEDIYAKTRSLYMDRIATLSRDRLRDVYGIDVHGNTLTVPFFGNPLTVDERDIVTAEGRPVPFEIVVVLARYLLMCPETLPVPGDWTAFRDFKDAGPLTVYYRDNVEGEIKNHFSDPANDITQAGMALGGYAPDLALSYDVVMAFDTLPHLSVLLLFNFPDEGFPSSCSLLFQDRADCLLDPESLAILGAVFARKLCGSDKAIRSPIS